MLRVLLTGGTLWMPRLQLLVPSMCRRRLRLGRLPFRTSPWLRRCRLLSRPGTAKTGRAARHAGTYGGVARLEGLEASGRGGQWGS